MQLLRLKLRLADIWILWAICNRKFEKSKQLYSAEFHKIIRWLLAFKFQISYERCLPCLFILCLHAFRPYFVLIRQCSNWNWKIHDERIHPVKLFSLFSFSFSIGPIISWTIQNPFENNLFSSTFTWTLLILYILPGIPRL